MGAYHTGLRMAHDTARACLRSMQEQPRHAAYWYSEARRHIARARWYIAWIRRGFA